MVKGRSKSPVPSTGTAAAASDSRTIDLLLNAFPVTPSSLLDSTGQPKPSLTFVVRTLFHHYYLAKYGDGAEDRGVYEYEQWLTVGPDWRFRGAGIGADKEAKIHVSNEIAKGFARWFLYEHLGMTYFCPFEDVEDRVNADGTVWKRKNAGDVPDYVCGRNVADVNLLEVKGRYRSVPFHGKEFDKFRVQIQSVHLLDRAGGALQVKGFISVARWATEQAGGVRSTLLVEDPMTDGQPPGPDRFAAGPGRAMVAGHYGPVLRLLRLPVYADAVRLGHPGPAETGARRGLWECIAGPLKSRRFVGGIIPDGSVHAWAPWWPFFDEADLRHAWRIARHASRFVLSRPASFFGVEESVFGQTIAVARQGLEVAGRLEPVVVPERTGSLTLLRDGTVLGPVDYFEPVGTVPL